jgi:predicted MFS family arabinose efflux permease
MDNGKRMSGARATAVMVLLVAIYSLNMLDRTLPFILAEAIKRDLSLSDAEIGLLGGTVFAVVYAFGGLPFGRLADKGFARPVVALSVAGWSLMTALGGFAQTFLHLALARLGVAAGEAASAPGGHSIINDHYPERYRASLIAMVSCGVPIGSMTGLMLGGWLVDKLSWREAFLAIGLPGMALGLVAWLVLPGPGPRNAALVHASLKDTIGYLVGKQTFRRTAVAASVYSFGGYSMVTFLPAFLMRSHDLSASKVGLLFGLVTGTAGLIGIPMGGWLADWLGRRDVRWRLRLPAIVMGLSGLFMIPALLVEDLTLCLILLFPPQMLAVSYLGPMFSAVHAIVPPEMRATATSALMGCLTLVGAALGPLAVGYVSDLLTPTHGIHALARALLMVPVTLLAASWLFHRASATLSGELYRPRND